MSFPKLTISLIKTHTHKEQKPNNTHNRTPQKYEIISLVTKSKVIIINLQTTFVLLLYLFNFDSISIQ